MCVCVCVCCVCVTGRQTVEGDSQVKSDRQTVEGDSQVKRDRQTKTEADGETERHIGDQSMSGG